MRSNLLGLLRFSASRIFWLITAVAVAVFLTIFIANLGGQMDVVRRAEIRAGIAQEVLNNPDLRSLPDDVRNALIEDLIQTEIHRLGLDRPFMNRVLEYARRALTLKLGFADFMMSDAGSRQVRLIILERLPTTLVLFGTAQLLLFFVSLFLALFLSRRYGSFLDRLTVGLAPSSAAPGWFYGIFLILIFAAVLRWLPFGRLVDSPPPETTWGYALSVAKHLVLPVTAVVIGALFASIYSWRTFFLIYSSEDYVELARAKGLSSRTLERRHIMRPTLPPIITSFLLLVIGLWTGQIVLESVFSWPGIGRLFFLSIQIADTPVIVGVIVIYGYLLALTVFTLDFIYAVLDPRVRVGGGTRRLGG